MKFTYNCEHCNTENSVDETAMILGPGMGEFNVFSDSTGLGNLLSGMGQITSSGRRIRHLCKKCNELNIIII